MRVAGAGLLGFLIAVSLAANFHPASAYTPQAGDQFKYSEDIYVNHGKGSYLGYSDQTAVTGSEEVNSVTGSNVSSSYDYSYQFSSNQGSVSSSSSEGNFTWSSSSFTYLNGTDNQVGYSKPVYVWFAMDPSTPVGGTFFALNTQFTVLSKGYSFQLPTQNRYVQTIEARGTGQYQRNDSYGVFAASYTWYEYFDPSTGYIVGYNYTELDTGTYQGQAGSFEYMDLLYTTSTSYPLAAASGPSSSSPTFVGSQPAYPGPSESDELLILGIGVLVVIAVVALFWARRRGRSKALPKHSAYAPPPTPPTPPAPSPAPWESKIDMGSKPPQQVVIRDVAMVNCKYCGTLIPSTAQTCPYCGGPRQ